LLHQISIVAAI